MDEEARAAAAFANHPQMPEDILRRMVVDMGVALLGVQTAIWPKTVEFLIASAYVLCVIVLHHVVERRSSQ